jgi:hypothetical protein
MAVMAATHGVLRTVPLFHGLAAPSSEQLEAGYACGAFARGRSSLHRDDLSNALYLIRTGG